MTIKKKIQIYNTVQKFGVDHSSKKHTYKKDVLKWPVETFISRYKRFK